jgi:hypothetical protein
MSAYRWVGAHAYRDHAHGRRIQPGELLPAGIAADVAAAHPDSVTETSHGTTDTDTDADTKPDDDVCGYYDDSMTAPCQRDAGWGRDTDSGRCKTHAEGDA